MIQSNVQVSLQIQTVLCRKPKMALSVVSIMYIKISDTMFSKSLAPYTISSLIPYYHTASELICIEVSNVLAITIICSESAVGHNHTAPHSTHFHPVWELHVHCVFNHTEKSTFQILPCSPQHDIIETLNSRGFGMDNCTRQPVSK